MFLHEYIDNEINEKKEWALRRQSGLSNDRQLLIITCMDERIPVHEALGLSTEEAHILRNAGGIITDDTIRSAMLCTHFFDIKEIIIIQHTDCEMMAILGPNVVNALQQIGINTDTVQLNPALPELTLQDQSQNFEKWIGMFDHVDDSIIKQVSLLQQSELIPDHIVIHGYIWQVESMSLRKPHEKVSEMVNDNNNAH